MRIIKKKIAPQQRLREKLYLIRLSGDIEKSKKPIKLEEILRLAREVKKTFRNEDLTQLKPNL